MPGFITV